MAGRLTNFQEFGLTFQSTWNLGAATTHQWHHGIYVTGTVTHSDADAETAALALASVSLGFASPATSLVKATYYPAHQSFSQWEKTYSPGTHAGTGSHYVSGWTGPGQQLEVAAVAHCPIGKNTRGKEIYLRRYFHNVDSGTDANALAPLVAGDPLAIYNTGAGPHAVVPCSPRTGLSGTGPWVMEQHLFTRQLRRKKKKKQCPSLADQLASAGMSVADVAKWALENGIKFLGEPIG